ncbi:MAG: rhomboid family intramembrane serine protease [Arenimonas sp.]
MNPLPPVTKALLWAMAIFFLLQQFVSAELIAPLMLWPMGDFVLGTGSDGLPVTIGFQPWQLITYGFLHGSFAHLFFNGLALYQFGGRLETSFGPRRYALYFFVCMVGAGLCQLLVTSALINSGSEPFPTIGASGGVFGLLLAYGMMFPHERVMLLIPPIPMSARTLVIVFGVIELVLGVTGTAAGIAHFAHLGGMAFGWLLLRYWRGQPPFKRRPPPRPRLVR